MDSPSNAIVFRNVRIFDGLRTALSEPSNVRVRGNSIESIGPASDRGDLAPGDRLIDGAGRVLMPGLIDAHWHAAFAAMPPTEVSADAAYINLIAGREAARTIQRGFTTVRDCGGPTFGIKLAIDRGVIDGPRIFPSGAFISQTAGHGDFRAPHELIGGGCTELSHAEKLGATALADGVDQVLRAVREQLMVGASQIKVMAGGGVSSVYDPIDVTQYTEPEMRAAVEAAENWGTYVMVHAYTARAITQAVRAGVKCIEHGHLIDERSVALLAEGGVWWSMQPFLDDDEAIPQQDAERRAKALQVYEGTDRAYTLARQHGVKLAWGTDTLFSASLAARQGKQLAKMLRWFSAPEVLVMATGTNAQLLALSGPRAPYRGKLGVVEEGALADLLLVDGDPLTNLDLLADPERSLLVIMKDGQIYKDLLAGATGGDGRSVRGANLPV